jgi:excisionase family DNA binding protein
MAGHHGVLSRSERHPQGRTRGYGLTAWEMSNTRDERPTRPNGEFQRSSGGAAAGKALGINGRARAPRERSGKQTVGAGGPTSHTGRYDASEIPRNRRTGQPPRAPRVAIRRAGHAATTPHDEVGQMYTDDVEQAIQRLAQAAEALTLDQRLRIAALLAQPATTQDTRPPIKPAVTDAVVLTVEEAAEVLKIGRTATYELIRTGQMRSIMIGRLRRIRHTDLIAYLDRQAALPGR